MPQWAIPLIAIGGLLVYALLAALCYGASCVIQGERDTYDMAPAFIIWPLLAIVYLVTVAMTKSAALGRWMWRR